MSPFTSKVVPMRSRLAVTALIVLVLPLTSMTAGRGAHPAQCSKAWNSTSARSRWCDALLYGVPVVLRASAECDGCIARVHAEVRISTSAIVLAECEAEARDNASCEAELSVFGLPVDIFASNIPLTCSVSGNDRGHLFCDSGCWDPSLGPHCAIIRPSPSPTD